ncbi:D-glucuronyl C5-epimerase family protein [Streptomyces bobili]|uniref:D-glucuronyl C5-epimerase family protein n=1 Tax=Streptomyces bobili TaxID=67280 RepID=UPI001FC9260C|nr:D-glucuronyl C5-epimerase family protein [Streptomyces bobili]
MAGGTVAGAAVVGGGTFTALATGVLDGSSPDLLDGIPRSLVLSLPEAGGADPVPPLPDQLGEGVLSAPSPGTRIPFTGGTVDPQTVEDSIPTTLPFEFKTSGYRIDTELPEYMRPWRDRPTTWSNVSPNTENVYLDAEGVIQYRPDWDTPGYDQPVTQIQFALGCITSYRNTTDPERKALFLKRARSQAKRLIDKRVEARGAWYFPYPFDWYHPEHSGVSYKAPWYSGMAQGEAISLFVQLSQLDGITEEQRTLYKAAADGTFASLLRGDNAKPWVVNKDKNGYLWIQEYPGATAGTGDYTFNGMIFATFGLWDYYVATGNELALKLYDGAVTTMRDHFGRLRQAKWLSYYCHTHRVPTKGYHQHHINLFRQLHWQTGSPVLAHQQDTLINDYPNALTLPKGSVAAFAAGTHTLYKLKTAGAPLYGWSPSMHDAQLGTKKVTFSRATQAPVDIRRRIEGRGIYYRISAGAYAGWWVGEYYPKVFLRGVHLSTTFRPQRTATFPPNVSITCIRFGSDGATGTTKTVKFAKSSSAPFDRRAIVNGRPMVHITAGGLTGYWAPAGPVLTDGH